MFCSLVLKLWCNLFLSPWIDKVLQRELSTLSKRMPSCMVQQISDCLRRSRALTDYEVQVIRARVTDMQQAVCLLQTLLHKGRTSCLLFFQCLNACSPSLFHTVTRGLGRLWADRCLRDVCNTCNNIQSVFNLFVSPAVKVSDEAHHHVEKSSFSGKHWWLNFSTRVTRFL